MHFTDYFVDRQDAYTKGSKLVVNKSRTMEQVKFVHSWCITREQLGRARITPSTNFAAGYDSAAYVWTANLRLTRPNKNKQVNPMYIQLSRKDLFRSHPLIVTATVTSYDGLDLDNALGRLCFMLTQTTGVPSNWTYHFRNDAAAVRKLLTSGTCVIIDFQMFYHPLLLIRRISGERIPSPISPLPNDFRYAHLTEGDFTFECADGRVPAQRHLLYVSSEYFRRQLDRNPSLSSHYLPYPKKLVAALVGYVHTLTFAFPESMRLEDVEPFLRLLDYFVLRRPDNAKLVSAAEMWMAGYLDKVSSNLREVVRCLCTAYEAEFDQVVIRACDLIVNNHYGNFEDTYRTDTSDQHVWTLLPTLRSLSVNVAYWRLNFRQGIDFRFSPMDYIHHMHAKTHCTRLLWY